jgi:pyruvate/2-oxoglutarate dehydrogenase complex dihydrolipoamide acyltransferase (E2) component
MFDLCIGTETLKEFFSHTNPLHQHLCWYPDAQNGDVRRVNGVPVTIFAGASLAAALQGSSAVPARHFAAAFQFSAAAAAAAESAAAPAAEIEDLFAAVTPEQQLRAGRQSLQTLVQQAAEQVTVPPAATICSSIPTLLTLAATDVDMELDSLLSAPAMTSADLLPLLTFSDGSVRDPLLTPAAAKAAALKHNQHRLVSMSRLMQQCWVFLLLLGAALLAGPV